MALDNAPDQFEWVSAQAACTPALMFERLRVGVKQDVDRRNGLVGLDGGSRFEFSEDGEASTSGGIRMKSVTLCLVLVVAAVGGVGLAAQGRPDFSGTWIGAGPQQGLRELTVKQDGSTLSLEAQPGAIKHTFKLDGSDTEMSAPDGKPLLAKAVWEGNTLVVTIHFPELKQDIRRQTWMIDADGQLVIETEFLGGKPEAPVKEVLKRR